LETPAFPRAISSLFTHNNRPPDQSPFPCPNPIDGCLNYKLWDRTLRLIKTDSGVISLLILIVIVIVIVIVIE
jgi:hypothetical protein